MSFAGKTDKALELRYFANALRNALGKGPLYDLKKTALHAEEQYKQEAEYPASTLLDRSIDLPLYGHSDRPNSFRLKRSIAAEYKRKRLNLEPP